MDTVTQTNPSKDNQTDHGLNVKAVGRNYGIGLGIITALYVILINVSTGAEDLSIGLRFAKHLIIIPVVWMAIAKYAGSNPDNNIFKGELKLLGNIAIWGAGTLALGNILFFAVTGTSFEQFMQEGNTIFGSVINSGVLIFETLVFVMIIGFVILQAYKGKGSPED